ncbi:MAG: carboxymuconolactone decarboxylase family protein [Arthrobacter sp.]|nr:carboxymuconolactone decarboxylase family protein [Arthrobacter sp.]
MSRPGNARVPLRPPGELDDGQLALYNRIVGGPRQSQAGQIPIVDRSGALLGPFGLMTIAPEIGDAIQAVGAALRFASSLEDLVREAAILLVATRHSCEFEWYAHAGAARAAGLDDGQLAALGELRIPQGLQPAQRAALGVMLALLEDQSLGDAQYHDAVDILGERQLAELVWLCGYYSQLALALAVFRPPMPAAAPGA